MVYIKGKNSRFYTFSYENSMVYMIGKKVIYTLENIVRNTVLFNN